MLYRHTQCGAAPAVPAGKKKCSSRNGCPANFTDVKIGPFQASVRARHRVRIPLHNFTITNMRERSALAKPLSTGRPVVCSSLTGITTLCFEQDALIFAWYWFNPERPVLI